MDLSTFQPNSVVHLASVVLSLLFVSAAAWIGRRWRHRAPAMERGLRHGWVAFVVVFQLFNQIRGLLPPHLDVQHTLPLHICDFVVLITPFALVLENRILRALLYFWGLGLSVNALIFPVLAEGPAQIGFWLYWVGHGQVIGSAVYVAAVLGFRPRLSDVLTAAAGIAVYNTIMLPINVVFDLDYGYTGPGSMVVDDLGPWPYRVLALIALELAAFVLLWLPWPGWDRLRHRRERTA